MKTITTKEKSNSGHTIVLPVPQVNWKPFYITMMVVLSLVLVFYVFSVNELTRGVYTIKNYNQQIGSLLKENKVLANSFSNNNFLIKTQERAEQLSFQKTSNVAYVQVLETTLAKR